MDEQIIVNGVVLPSPIQIDYNYEDLDADSVRDVSTGILDRNRIRSDTLKISISYAINSSDEIKMVMSAISAATFNVELFDLKSGKRKTFKMYAGPKSMQLVKYQGLWIKGMKFNLVEV